MTVLQADLNTVCPLLTNTPDNEVNSQVEKLLHKLGVCHLSATDVIHHHIVPVLKSETWKVGIMFATEPNSDFLLSSSSGRS